MAAAEPIEHDGGRRPDAGRARTRPVRPAVVRGVIFDVDGTLLDSNGAHAVAWVAALAEGGHPVRYDDVLPLMGMGGDKVLPILAGIEPHGPPSDRINARRARIFFDELPLLRPQPGARHLVTLVRDHGLEVAVASSATGDELRQLLIAADVGDLVGEVVVSKDDAARSKPDPDIVCAALHRLGLAPDQVVMIGDTPYDIVAAAEAGVATIALRCGGWSSGELADAIAVYDNPQDLANDYDASPLAGRRTTGAR